MLKTFKSFLILAVTALLLSACNKGPGEGGTGTVQGFVKLVHHPDDDYTLTPDILGQFITMLGKDSFTKNVGKTDVFIIYGDEAYFGDDAETNANGMYRFEYLRPGNYTVFAYSTLPSGEKVAVSETVELQRGTIANVPTLYIHDGKAYGTSVVKGRVHAAYYHNGSYRGEGWACEHRVYIRRVGDDIPFDDTRVGPDGYFAFQKLQPGEYEVYTVTQDFNEVPDFVFQTIMVEEAGQVYEFLEQFEVIINV